MKDINASVLCICDHPHNSTNMGTSVCTCIAHTLAFTISNSKPTHIFNVTDETKYDGGNTG